MKTSIHFLLLYVVAGAIGFLIFKDSKETTGPQQLIQLPQIQLLQASPVSATSTSSRSFLGKGIIKKLDFQNQFLIVSVARLKDMEINDVRIYFDDSTPVTRRDLLEENGVLFGIKSDTQNYLVHLREGNKVSIYYKYNKNTKRFEATHIYHGTPFPIF